MGGGKGGGGKKGGGGGGDIDVDVDSDSNSTTVLDIVGLDDVNINSTTSSTNTNRLEVPEPIRSRMEMALTEPIDTRLTLSVPDTVRTDQRQRNELAITEPIITQMSTDVDVDVKPVVVDLCLTLGVKDPPRFCLTRPEHRHFNLSLFGREVVGLRWGGTSRFIVDDVRPNAFVAGVTDAPQHDGSGTNSEYDGSQGHRHHGGHRASGEPEAHRRAGVRFVID